MFGKERARYVRRRKVHNKDLENTPFQGLSRDICTIMLDLLNTEDVFALMLVSKNTKIIAYDENHWKKRVYILFRVIDINNVMLGSTITDKMFRASGYKYRLLTVKLLNTQYTKDAYLKVLKSRFEQEFAIPVLESCVDAIRNTIARYVKHLSLRPFSEFVAIIKSAFPEKLEIGGEFINLHLNITEKFDKYSNRFGLVDMFIDLMIFIYYTIRPSGTEINDEYVMFVLDLLRTFINDEENSFAKFIGPYIIEPKEPYICCIRDGKLTCNHLWCEKRKDHPCIIRIDLSAITALDFEIKNDLEIFPNEN